MFLIILKMNIFVLETAGKKEKLEKFTNPREKANIFSVISFL